MPWSQSCSLLYSNATLVMRNLIMLVVGTETRFSDRALLFQVDVRAMHVQAFGILDRLTDEREQRPSARRELIGHGP